MRALTTGFLTDALEYVSIVVNNASNRWLHALDKLESTPAQYSAEDLIADVYGTWKDIVSWPVLGNVGGFPYNAFVQIDGWHGVKKANPVPKMLTPAPISDALTPVPGPPDPIKITELTRIGSSGNVFPAANVVLNDTGFSVTVELQNLNALAANPPSNGHYFGLLYQKDNILAHVHVLVNVTGS